MKLANPLKKKVALQIKREKVTKGGVDDDDSWFVEGKNEWKKKSLETFRFCDLTIVP